MANSLSLWVVCKHPLDYPNKFTAREHVVRDFDNPSDTLVNEVYVADDLETIQHFLRAKGLVRIDPDAADDPVIEEVWV